MHAFQVNIRVKPEFIAEFQQASCENARLTLQEPGAIRFDVLQSADDPTCFIYVEVYRQEKDHLAHKETAHYKKWRMKVDPWMQEPRTAVRYLPVFVAASAAGSASAADEASA
ncbi:MAG: antibiotic biosynthesis monooxygenase [Verrucomicrobiia bacterium]